MAKYFYCAALFLPPGTWTTSAILICLKYSCTVVSINGLSTTCQQRTWDLRLCERVDSSNVSNTISSSPSATRGNMFLMVTLRIRLRWV
ncbi:hypothetical protein F5Y07DRAFT_370858, partial [Xylaria sp. FL0933]